MIQSILFFSLGFLCAGFLALMLAPAVWRRAVRLTRRRIEASVPLTLNEIQADKDRLRAEFAMSTRRLEMSIKEFKDKAAAQIIEINRNREELKRLGEERSDRNETLSALEARAGEMRHDLHQKEEQLARTSERLAHAEQELESRAAELERLGRMYDEAAFASSSRHIELVARESEVEKLSGDLTSLKGKRKEIEDKLHEANAEVKALRDDLKAERKRAAEFERKNERMIATLSDREEKLDRREKELARLRDRIKGSSSVEEDLGAKLTEAQTERVQLETEIAELQIRISDLLSGSKGGELDRASARLKEERDNLQAELDLIRKENRRLKADLNAFEKSKAEDWNDERRASALLREQMNDLAAEVVNLTAMLEGPDSPIAKALADVPASAQAMEGDVAGSSLADRVRALQKSASAR